MLLFSFGLMLNVTFSGCSMIRISDSEHQHDKEGIYEMMSGESCTEYPVYKQIRGQNFLFLLKYMWDRIWMVGETKCRYTNGIIRSYNFRPTPEQTTIWEELYGGRYNTSSIKVICLQGMYLEQFIYMNFPSQIY